VTFRDPNEAFARAIEEKRLSGNKLHLNYAGRYMYMGTDADGRDLFKNIETRSYDV
jgi:hypothetical protein